LTQQGEPLQGEEDDSTSYRNPAIEDDPLEVDNDTLSGSTIQKIGEPRDSLMRAPDTRLFKQAEFIHDIERGLR
jgi:hypothetical protein